MASLATPLKLFNMTPLAFFFSDLSSVELFFHQILTNISSSMTSTIFLRLSRVIFMFAFASFCKHVLKSFGKISSHPDCIRPCHHIDCCYASINSKREHPSWALFSHGQIPAPGREDFSNIRPVGKKHGLKPHPRGKFFVF